ncbi:hypothetical protein BB560_005971 [Smittium megazygosporum]|uniref:Transketolase n=1 Tax=Smittium megazygosporum TaxID=133381 RepID=A0A2T9YNP2_9FUNG|nr:hypothetical protein BB560_005971 [Smittium megazygosporum]
MSSTKDIDVLSIDTIRCLAADVVFKSNSGHPGAPMGCAPMAHVLFSRFINANPKNPNWINRDRFVLSNGHACALQYILLHFLGYDISMEDLKQFRQLHSKTPGHPERLEVPGIEVTTGPLGQGISNAVGLAIAEKHLAATYNTDDFKVIDNNIYCIVGDGCLQEGVASEASSLAGHLQLGNLVVLYDANNIQIDGSIDLAFTEDVLERYRAYGWHTSSVEDGDTDIESIFKAIQEAKNVTDKPSIIKIKTTIGFGSMLQGTAKVHGSPLKEDDIFSVKQKLGLDPSKKFFVDQSIYDFYAQRAAQGAHAEQEWWKLLDQYKTANPELYAQFERVVLQNKLPDNFASLFPRFTPADPPTATRRLSQIVISAFADKLPGYIGGSADLTSSNLTNWPGVTEFQPPSSKLGDYAGRYIRYGVREHGMFAISNGIAAYGGLIPFASTFLNFISYGVGATRLSALQKLRVLYIMTHDSIGVGEDGPTHQPIETVAMLRATPNTHVFRPADGNETSAAYISALSSTETPSVLCLSRQNLPHLEGTSIEKALTGGYVLCETSDKPDVIIVSTGSEVQFCVDVAQNLKPKGISVRVVSMPCNSIFDAQPAEYQDSVLTPGIPVVSVEAMSTLPWFKYAHHPIGIDTFGASGKPGDLYDYFGLTPEKIAAKVEKVVSHYKSNPVPIIDRRLW